MANLPNGYETEVDSRSYSYITSGLIQRISFARILTVKPRILLIDKIDNEMDDKSEEIYYELLKKLKGLLTIVFIYNLSK